MEVFVMRSEKKKIRNVLVIACALIMAILLTSCGKSRKSEEVESVETLIFAIGNVTIDSEKAIFAAEEAYRLLSAEDQNKVENYNILIKARNDYEAIPKAIALTTANVGQYLAFEVSYGEETNRIYGPFYTGNSNIKIYPTRPGFFSDVKMSIKVPCPTGWQVSGSDSAYNTKDDDTMFIDVTLPTDGYYTKKVELTTMLGDFPMYGESSVKVISISGTFKEK